MLIFLLVFSSHGYSGEEPEVSHQLQRNKNTKPESNKATDKKEENKKDENKKDENKKDENKNIERN